MRRKNPTRYSIATRGQRIGLWHALADGIRPHDPERAEQLHNAGDHAFYGSDEMPAPIPVMDQEKRQLIFDGEILHQTLDQGTSMLLESPEPIEVVVRSSGGCGRTAMRIADRIIRWGGQAVCTIHRAHSAAAILAMAGSHRRMFRGSQIMIHRGCTLILGNSAGLRKRADELDAIENETIELFMARTGQPRAIVESWHDGRDHFFNAEEAKAVGLIHEII